MIFGSFLQTAINYGNIVQELAAAAKHLGMPVNIVGDAREEFS